MLAATCYSTPGVDICSCHEEHPNLSCKMVHAQRSWILPAASTFSLFFIPSLDSVLKIVFFGWKFLWFKKAAPRCCIKKRTTSSKPFLKMPCALVLEQMKFLGDLRSPLVSCALLVFFFKSFLLAVLFSAVLRCPAMFSYTSCEFCMLLTSRQNNSPI